MGLANTIVTIPTAREPLRVDGGRALFSSSDEST
jgi:hypothetical protein